MELTVLDWVLVGVTLFVTAVGLWRGLSGELGTTCGFAAAAVAGFLAYGLAGACAARCGFAEGAMRTGATVVADLVFMLLAFGVVRAVVARSVRCLVPQPTNALLGALLGLVKCGVGVFLLLGAGLLRPGEYATGIVAQNSNLVRALAVWLDAFAG